MSPNGPDYSAGLFGFSQTGEGVFAVSLSGNGVIAETVNNGTQTGASTSAMIGFDAATDTSGNNNGVYGQSKYGFGVIGVGVRANNSFASVGVVGATLAQSKTSTIAGDTVGAGLAGFDSATDGGLRNVGVLGRSHGVGVAAIGMAPPQPAGQIKYPALRASCLRNGDALTGVSYTTEVFNFDCRGNLVLAGAITTQGATRIATAVREGPAVLAFSARTASATIEDVGSAALVNGVARVTLDATFSRTIDPHAQYFVFLTPSGDSRGLYVKKDAVGFTVYENGAGHHSLSFDYRIVAKPIDAPGIRLPAAQMSSMLATTNALSIDTLAAQTRLGQHLWRHSQ